MKLNEEHSICAFMGFLLTREIDVKGNSTNNMLWKGKNRSEFEEAPSPGLQIGSGPTALRGCNSDIILLWP